MADALRRHQPIPVWQAARDAPTFAALAERAQASGEWFKMVRSLIPPALRGYIQPGPIEDDEWCLLVSTAAAAAKLRQLSPALLAHLRSRGCAVARLRIKIVKGRSG